MRSPPPAGTSVFVGRGGGRSPPPPPATPPFTGLGLPTRGRRSNCAPSPGRGKKIGVTRVSESGPEQRMAGVCGVAQSRWAIPSRLLRTAQQLREEAEAPQTRVELRATETEGDRGPGLVAPRAPERLEDRLLLDRGQRLDGRWRAGDGGRAGQAHSRGRRGRDDPEVGGGDEPSIGEDERSLDGVLQFTDVARPAVRQKEIASLRAETCLTPSHPARELAQEVVGQHEDVVRPFLQGREMDAEDGESVVEITAETPIHDGLLQIAVGRRDETDVGAERRRATDTFVLALLDDAEELGFDRGRQLADLVEEQRAARGQLEAAALEPVGSREGATLGPEELRLDERLGHGRAVDGDEGTLGTPARIVDGASDQFLARAAFPREQHGGLCRSDARRLIDRLPEGRSLSDDPIEAVLVAQGPPEPPDSLFELPGAPFDGGEPAF